MLNKRILIESLSNPFLFAKHTFVIPAMKADDYHVSVNPTDLMLGLTGCHSNFLPMFRKVAEEMGVSLLCLIAEVSTIDCKDSPEGLMWQMAAKIKV